MKIYRDYKKTGATAFFLLAFSTVTSLIIKTSLQNYVAYLPVLFILLTVLLFEYQKSAMIKLLKQKFLGDDNAAGFIYDNGLSYDFFENLLVLSSDKIVVATCYLAAQRYFNTLIGKASYLKVYETKATNVRIDPEAKTIVLEMQNNKETLKLYNYGEFIRELDRFKISYR